MTSARRLEKITAANIDAACAVAVRPDQDPFVESVARSLAEAYVHPEMAWPRLILDGDQPVGFVMAFLDVHFYDTDPPELLRSGLWRLNIDAGHQGRGYGRFAVEAVCAEIRRRGGTRATVTWATGEGGPEGFYLGLGFRPTGELSGDQIVGELDLTATAPAAA
ncbi:GNAT family N-acetyltransferase [Longispora sp. K20-0274]|uniref:GNAT family N-acetyltransferase n=1 Tax=Longispora sp. K20-0274 TaxID=3088255 RepID=UPI0039999DAB